MIVEQWNSEKVEQRFHLFTISPFHYFTISPFHLFLFFQSPSHRLTISLKKRLFVNLNFTYSISFCNFEQCFIPEKYTMIY